MIKKLCLYCLDCIKLSGRSSGFNNIKGNKDNKIIVTDAVEFAADDRNIVDIMTLSRLNQNTMSLVYGVLFLEGCRNKQKYYSPLLYASCQLTRSEDKIILQHDEDFTINVGLISSLIDDDADLIGNTIEQLLEIEHPEKIDFKAVLSGLINLNGLTIKEEKAVILAKIPESVAGLLSELKKISEDY